MRIIKLSILLTVLTVLISCGSGTSKQPATAEGFGAIEQELKSKFGANAFYTDLKIIYINDIGNTISTTITKAPESLKMAEWDLAENTWRQRSEVALEVPRGAKAEDFMFQLNDKINLTKLGELVEKSLLQLKSEKNIKDPILSIASIKFPKNGKRIETQYSIQLKQEHGGTSFGFLYTLDGDLIRTNY